MQKTTAKFIDANNNLGYVEAEVEKLNGLENARDYDTLEPITTLYRVHIYNDLGNFKPASEPQKKLLKLQRSLNFRDMFAGTKIQTEYLNGEKFKADLFEIMRLKDFPRDEFFSGCAKYFGVSVDAVEAAEAEALKYGHPKNMDDYLNTKKVEDCDYFVNVFLLALNNLLVDRGYRYGTAWLYKEIKQEEIDELFEVVYEVREEYVNKTENSTTEDFDDETVDKLMASHPDKSHNFIYAACALSLAFGHDIEEVIENLDEVFYYYYEYLGHDYYIGNDDQLTDAAIRYLTDEPSIWKECVADGGTDKGLQEWAEEVVDLDGFDLTLNSYDGGCKSYEIGDTDIYVVPTDHKTSLLR